MVEPVPAKGAKPIVKILSHPSLRNQSKAATGSVKPVVNHILPRTILRPLRNVGHDAAVVRHVRTSDQRRTVPGRITPIRPKESVLREERPAVGDSLAFRIAHASSEHLGAGPAGCRERFEPAGVGNAMIFSERHPLSRCCSKPNPTQPRNVRVRGSGNEPAANGDCGERFHGLTSGPSEDEFGAECATLRPEAVQARGQHVEIPERGDNN
jgi:hypothetical protein